MTARSGTRAILLAFAGIYIIWGTTFLGIAPAHVLGFILAQILGALVAVPVSRVLQPQTRTATIGTYVE